MRRAWIFVAAGALAVGLIVVGVRLWGGAAGAKAPQAAEAQATVTDEAFQALLKKAEQAEQGGEWLLARQAYKEIVTGYGSRPGIADAQKRYEDANMKVVFSAINVPGETETHVVKEGESLSLIADKYRTTVPFIKKQNGLSGNIIRPNMRLRIWTGRFSVMVDKSQNLLFLQSNGEGIKTYTVSTGKNNITPVGTFKIINKLVHPDWTHEGRVIPYGNPENILGTRWLGFDVPGYGIHGTTQPEAIGQQATAGCVRMLNSEVEEIYDLLPLNTEVTIVD